MLKATMMSSLLDTERFRDGTCRLDAAAGGNAGGAASGDFSNLYPMDHTAAVRARRGGEEQHQRRHLHSDRASPQGLSSRCLKTRNMRSSSR